MAERGRICQHNVHLGEGRVRLRPLTEGDWETLLRWNSDAEVLYYCEGDDVAAYGLEDIHGIYRSVCRSAFCFVIEVEGAPVGECWLQRMNLDWISERFPGQDLRRIDLMVGEKALWGRGIGSEAIRLPARFGFEREGMDAVFGCCIADYNPRSLGAFRRAGFEVWQVLPEPPGRKAARSTYAVLTRERFAHLETTER